MTGLRLQAKLFIFALALLAFGAIPFTLHFPYDLSNERMIAAAVFAVFMAVAMLFPLHVGFKTKLALDTSVIFAAILLFPPAIAMLIAASGTILAHLVRREPLLQAIFNTSQTALQAAGGSLLLAMVGWNTDQLQFNHPVQMAAIAGAAVVMYLINTLSVATVVGLQSGMAPLHIWYHSAVSLNRVEHISQLGLGLLGAAVVDVHLWTMPLLVLLAFVVYLSLERHVQLRQQTVDAVESLADMVDLRDRYTADHSRRVAAYARELAIALDLTPDEVDLVERAARVHDIGKVLIDSRIISKGGPLDDLEWQEFKRHPVTGAEILSRFPQFALATRYVRHHHERIDGGGYPDRLSGEQIPFGARIIAVADSFDAMTSNRAYRPALAAETVLAEFQRQSGSQWDDRVVAVLLELIEKEQIVIPRGSRTPEELDRLSNVIPFKLPS
jgi:HD-GYP domain-containing protein (c-di-GMP phosphodiesterase class II)